MMGLVWGTVAFFLQMEFKRNPERFYQKFLLTPWSVIYGAIPIGIAIYYQKKQSKVYRDLYEKYVGKLSDE